MMAKTQRPLSTIFTLLLFLAAMLAWSYNSMTQQLKFKDIVFQAEKQKIEDEVREQMTLEIMSFDRPERAIVEAGFDGKVKWSNNYAKVYWGLTIGASIHDSIPEDQQEQHRSDFEGGVEKAQNQEYNGHVHVVHTIYCEAINAMKERVPAIVQIFSTKDHFIVLIDKQKGTKQ